MWRWAQLLGFNLYWLLAVKWQLPGPLLAMLLLHFLCSPSRKRDLRLLPMALAGSLLDLQLWRLGLFDFKAGFPLWLVLLWVGFALTLAHGMRWLLAITPLATGAVWHAWGDGLLCGGGCHGGSTLTLGHRDQCGPAGRDLDVVVTPTTVGNGQAGG